MGEGVEVPAGGLPEHRHECRFGERSHLADRREPRWRSLVAVTGPTPHSRSTGSGWRKPSSAPRGTTSSPPGLATPLATLARNLVLATPTVMGSPTRSRTSRRRRAAISMAEPESRSSTDVEKRLVDREPLDQWRGLVEHLEDRPARVGIRRHPR